MIALPASPKAGFYRAWLGWVSLGEGIGFLAPVLLQRIGSGVAPALMLPLLIFAGLVEGALLGWSQAHVLRRLLPALSRRRWMLLTSAAAATAWLLGLAPSEFSQIWTAWPLGLQLTVGVLAGAALLASIGAAQWLELRRHLPRSRRWILGSSAAWLVGLLVFLAVATPLWQPGQPPAQIALIGVLAGAAMAISMAAVTGLVMVRLALPARIPGVRTRHAPGRH
ncbi:hypothetical protein [Specibacter sp. RAF43]|uniref:hypothetical protein n=1 Tax=Specibacter sp. RAF43 TaxID=3233057 RepID=UPI003F9C78CA